MVNQECLERQLEFDFMKDWRTQDKHRPFQFGVKELLSLTTYFSIGLSFYSSCMHYIKPVDNDTLTSQLFYFLDLVGIGATMPYFAINIIQDSIKKSR